MLAILTTSCATQTSANSWDKTHQDLYDAAIVFRRDARMCEARLESCNSRLVVATSTAARVKVVRRYAPGLRDLLIAVGLGVLAGVLVE